MRCHCIPIRLAKTSGLARPSVGATMEEFTHWQHYYSLIKLSCGALRMWAKTYKPASYALPIPLPRTDPTETHMPTHTCPGVVTVAQFVLLKTVSNQRTINTEL